MRYVYQESVQDKYGKAVSGATVTVTLAGGTTAASIYTAVTGGTVDADGIITTGDDGTFEFFVDEANYSHSQKFRIVWAKSGFTSETWDYIQIFPDSYRTLLTSATVDQGDSAIVGTLAWHIADAAGPVTVNVLPGTYKITTNITTPSTMHLDIKKGGIFKPDASKVLTVDSPSHIIAASNQRIIDITNNSTNPLDFTNGGEVFVGWIANGDGTTDESDEINAVIAAAGDDYIITFEPVLTYVITGNPALVFDTGASINFNNCRFSYAQNNTAIVIGKTAASEYEGWINGHVRLSRTATITQDGSQTAASQLLGTGIKFLNLWSWKVNGPMYVTGFKYGYYFEGDAAGMTSSEFHNLQSQDCLVDFFFKNVSAVGSYITALDFYNGYTVFNPAFYSDVVDTRLIESVRNGYTIDGINFHGGVYEAAKEVKLDWDASWSSFNGCYWDQPNGATDIIFTSNANYNIIDGGIVPGWGVSDSGLYNDLRYPRTFRTDRDGTVYLGRTGTQMIYPYQADSFADDDYLDLPDATQGMVIVTAGAESGIWATQVDGTVTKFSGTANTAVTDSDTNLCVFPSGTTARVKNRLGSAQKVQILYFYN